MTKDELCKLYPQIECTVDVKEGWLPLIAQALSELAATKIPFTVECIKEKFGGLRIYPGFTVTEQDNPDDSWQTFNEIIGRAEDKSLSVCEDCGKPGALRPGGWIRTLCHEHAEGRRPSFLKMQPNHQCRNAWNICAECNQPSCSACSLACYQCVHAWRHHSCAKKHAEETKHAGNINDLVWHLDQLDHSAQAEHMKWLHSDV